MTAQSVSGCRRPKGWIVTLVVAGLFCLPSLGWGQTHAQAAKELSKAFSAAAKEAVPAVVSIKVEKTIAGPAMGFGGADGFNNPFGQYPDDFLRRFFGDRLPQQRSPRKYRQEGQGSGFIISKDGYILTNNHVVGDVDKITVELKDGRTFTDAKLIGTDPDSEVALIKIDGDNFPVLPMGDSGKIEIGDWVIAVGNPFGLSETVTVGVISAVGRNNMHITQYEDFIQTDAAINPGNSGGPLINLDGEVIGINTAIVSQSGGYMGIGFAIPINMARTIGEQLKANGKVSRGYLGLLAKDVDSDMASLLDVKEAAGVIVSMVQSGSPAEKAGLKVNDIILTLNGKKIASYDAFRNEVAMLSPGTKVRLEIQRGGQTVKLTAILADRDTTMAKEKEEGPATAKEPQRALGLQVQDLTADLAERLHYAAGEGVLISAVDPGSPAAEKGIQAGDLILSVNGRAVTSAEEFTAAVKRSKEGKVLLLVKRGEVSQFVTVATE
jgi:serine protease Do